jgi:hypothetical protein
MTIAMLIAGGVRAADGDLVERYFTLAYDGDHVTLAANETALVIGTAVTSLDSPAWTTFQYQRGTNQPTLITLLLGNSGNVLPLSGPGEVVLTSTNWDYAGTGPGIVGLRIVRSTANSRTEGGVLVVRYHTLLDPKDRVKLADNETAIIVGTASVGPNAWVNLLYSQGTNNPVPITLQLGVSGVTLPLSGPGEIALATNDASTSGDNSPGAVGLKIVRTIHRNDRN